MTNEPSWEDLANAFWQTCQGVEPLIAKWFAYEGREDYGIWLLLPAGPDTDEIRATFSLLAARAIDKLRIPPAPSPEPSQYCPHWDDSCAWEEEMARRAGRTFDVSQAVPYGLERADWDAVDACSRAWLELLRRESQRFKLSPSGEVIARGNHYVTTSGTVRDVCRASAVYSKRLAREEIREDLTKRGQLSESQGKLLEVSPRPTRAARASGQKRKRARDPRIQLIKEKIRKLREDGLTHKEICDRLGSTNRPPRAGWRELPWPRAYKQHTQAVTKWLSEAYR